MAAVETQPDTAPTDTAPSDAAEQVIEAARALAPIIAGRAAEIESARRLPRDLLDEPVAAGCFRITQPRSHRGIGAP